MDDRNRNRSSAGAGRAAGRTSDHAALSTLAPVGHTPLYERAYRALRRALMAGKFHPGEPLTVRAVARALGVSAMPVRAALTRLRAERAVSLLANGTVVIPSLPRDRLVELMELRILLEGTATERAAARMTQSERSRAGRLALVLLERLRQGETERYLQANAEFKFHVYRCARSPELLVLIEWLWLQVGPFLRHYGKDMHYQEQSDRPQDVLAAIEIRDSLAARRAMERDIRDGLDFLLQTVDFDEPPVPRSPPRRARAPRGATGSG